MIGALGASIAGPALAAAPPLSTSPKVPMKAKASHERRGYVDGRFGQIHFRRLGEGRPAILIHQTPWSSVQFMNAAPILAAAGIEAISVDTPGYGLSDTPPAIPTIEDYAEAVGDLIDGLGLKAPAVVGHHTGALIAGALAARRGAGLSALVLHGAPLYTPEEREARKGRKPHAQDLKPDGSHLTDRWAYLKSLPGERMSDAARQMAVLTYYNNGPLEWYGHTAAYAYDFGRDVPAITCPTLIMASLGDPIHGHGARTRERRPDWAYADLPGSTEVIFDNPQAWAAPVTAFLKS